MYVNRVPYRCLPPFTLQATINLTDYLDTWTPHVNPLIKASNRGRKAVVEELLAYSPIGAQVRR